MITGCCPLQNMSFVGNIVLIVKYTWTAGLYIHKDRTLYCIQDCIFTLNNFLMETNFVIMITFPRFNYL